MEKLLGAIAILVTRPLWGERKGRPGLQASRKLTHNTDLFRSYSWKKFALTAWQITRSVDSSLRNCCEEADAWFAAIHKILKVFANFTLDNLMILLNSSKTDAISLQAASIWFILRPQACVKWLRIGVSFCFASFRIVSLVRVLSGNKLKLLESTSIYRSEDENNQEDEMNFSNNRLQIDTKCEKTNLHVKERKQHQVMFYRIYWVMSIYSLLKVIKIRWILHRYAYRFPNVSLPCICRHMPAQFTASVFS